MRRRPYGPCAWLLDDVDDPVAWSRTLTSMHVAGIEEIIPTERAVVVRCERGEHDVIGTLVDRLEPGPATSSRRSDRDDRSDDPLTIDVVYDGPDVAELAELAQLSVDEVVRLHHAGTYRVAFCGFSPGFGYLRGLDPRLHVPRRPIPRTSVPAGSVGIAAGYTCVYPSPSPGGWYLVGHTSMALWDVTLDPPALMLPGRTVRFRNVS